METRLTTERPEDTVAAGRALAAGLAPGTTVTLDGELGAGKTHFVRGMVQGWGGTERATSPTFTLLHEYTTPRGPVFHLDLYRAQSAEEIWSAAHDELADPDGLVVIEWAGRFPALIPSPAMRVTMKHAGEGRRTITIARDA
ncbi:MAG: tRNA (adenosine(37)-N6)-threonylcarbamoyltransferase complex ATPase subunit type 1 TsaE [Chthoniobacterales bacterium]